MVKLGNIIASTLIKAHIEPHQPLVVGVSGGADSLALLHGLSQQWDPARLVVAHLDHMLRPESADDATFVAEICAAWGIDCTILRVDVAELARAQGWSLEQAGRHARYRFFADVARAHQASAVLVAHHLDDQVETVLLHILRGAGLGGLQGMQPVAPLPDNPDLRLVRPLLNVSRGEIDAYCQTHDLHPRHDASNQDTTFLRNQIRHDLVPLLTEINPNIRQRIVDLAHSAESDNQFLQQQTAEILPTLIHTQQPDWIDLHRGRFAAQPVALQRRALRTLVAQLLTDADWEMSFATIEQARLVASAEASGTHSSLPEGIVLSVHADTISLRRASAERPIQLPQLADATPRELPVPGQLLLENGWLLTAELIEMGSAEVVQNRDPWTAYVDIGPVKSLTVRARQPGERYAPLGMDGHTMQLKTAMINWKIDQPLRAHWPIVSLADQLVWIVGCHQDNAARIVPASKNIIQLRCRQL